MNDLVAPLQAAISRADPNWVSQPSHLRRRLEEELGPEARRHRSQVHQLVVAAEERIPLRLQRNGWSPVGREDLGHVLVATRGWTKEAADWTVTTWAAALGLSDERPAVPVPVTRTRSERSPGVEPAAAGSPLAGATAIPSEVVPTPSVAPVRDAFLATEIPSEAVASVTALPSETTPLAPPPLTAGVTALPDEPPPPPPTRRDDGASAAPLPPGNRTITRRASAYLDRPLDAAYETKAGPSPVLLAIGALPVGLASLVVTPAMSAFVLMAFLLIIVVGSLVWPARIVAVSGDDVWLLRKHGYGARPTALLATGTRDEITFAGGRLLPSVQFRGQRLWFQSKRSAARRLPAGPVGATAGASA